MSLQEIDKYLHYLEAIESYDRVKLDCNQASEEVIRLNAEVENLEQKLAKMEHLVITSDGKTGSEVATKILAEEEKEIDRRVKELVVSRLEEWRIREKPKEVSEKAVSKVRDIVRVIQKRPHSPTKYYSEDPQESALVREVERVLEQGVLERLNQEFQRRVDQRSTALADQKLDALIDVEWPNFLRPRAEELAARIEDAVFAALQNEWSLPCNKCKQTQSFSLTPEDISSLLRSGELKIECRNPGCRDFLGKHRFPVSLIGLIESYLVR